MKLLRLKITDAKGFRSLQSGFEYHFRTEFNLQEELSQSDSFAPFVCAGPNGSGKSNLLELLAAIFFQLEVLRVRRSFLPEVLQNANEGFTPVAFELDYLIRVPPEYISPNGPERAKVTVWKEPEENVRLLWENRSDFDSNVMDVFEGGDLDYLLPQYVLGYSSGENEILSLPFFKMRFIQFDEYWDALKNQLSYPGRPETRLAYLDSGFSQAILLCNFLFHDREALEPFRDDVGIDELKEFRIIIRRSIEVSAEVASIFMEDAYVEQGYVQDDYVSANPALVRDSESGRYTINLMQLLEEEKKSGRESGENQSSYVNFENFDPIVTRLKRCATCSFVDDATDTLYLDYYVNDATKEAFRANFDQSPVALFQALQVLLALNLYSVSDDLKTDLYQSDSHYISETVPVLASDERIMRFKFVQFTNAYDGRLMMLKSLSDGEHQLLHSLGICLLFRNTNSLFLLDEPETHFNPGWRSNFITRLNQCFKNSEDKHEILITTHTPFLISDSKPEKVLVFKKDKETKLVSVGRPDYNTFGASINKITMNTFGKRETIGGRAQAILEGFREQLKDKNKDKEQLIDEINQQMGDSVEKLLLIKTILDSMEEQG